MTIAARDEAMRVKEERRLAHDASRSKRRHAVCKSMKKLQVTTAPESFPLRIPIL